MAKTITVEKSGGMVDMEPLAATFAQMRNGKYDVTIKRASEVRTMPQNALLWLWLGCMERETGTAKEDIYLYYCDKFLSRYATIKGKVVRVVDTTSGITKERMSAFMDSVKVDALTEFGINLPMPEDRYFEYFYQEFT